MRELPLRLAEAIAVLGSVAGIGYYFLSIWSAWTYLRNRSGPRQSSSFRPPVSILKPLKGTDPEMYECFRSHCLQNYPEYEIIFGVSERSDPAIQLVERLQREFPERKIRLMICSDILGTNVKVSNLAQMAREVQYEYLLVDDSDIRVEPDYLDRVMGPLSDSKVGLVTALYRGVPAGTVGSHLEALGISTDFSAGVLSALAVEGGIRFGLGSTLAFRKRELQAIGGFEALLDYLADDYELGARTAAMGLRVELASCVVETYLPPYSLTGFLSHQLRWSRAVRDSRSWGHLGLMLTFGVPWAIVAAILAKGALWSWLLLAGTFLVRGAMAWIVGRKVDGDPLVARLLWVVPFRDVISAFVWLASYAGHKIHWRGADFYLRERKLVRIE
jgi:ceramide glucosyltransferase